MKIGIYPGSFDPVTFGHIDMIERAAKMFDKLYIVVTINTQKKVLFSAEERTQMIKEVCKKITNIEVVYSNKLTVDCAKELGAHVIVRGLRAVTDFEYELQMASTNHSLNSDIETIFMMTNTKYSYLSSSLVKEIISLGGDISKFVPEFVSNKLKEKYNR